MPKQVARLTFQFNQINQKKIKYFDFWFFLLILFAPVISHSQNTDPNKDTTSNTFTDWIFVLDTSASMVGKGENAKNIFGEVKGVLKVIVQNTLKKGDSLDFYCFDENVVYKNNFRINDQKARDEVSKLIDSLNPTGSNTHTGEAIISAFERAQVLRESIKIGRQSAASARTPVVLLITDGIEDIKSGSKATPLSSIPHDIIQTAPYTFFVWVGNSKDEFKRSSLENFRQQLGAERGVFLDYSGANNLSDAVDKIKEKVNTLTALLSVKPITLNFETTSIGDSTLSRTVEIEVPQKTGLSFSLDEQSRQFFTLESPSSSIIVDKGITPVEIRLKALENAPEEKITGKIKINLDEAQLENINISSTNESGEQLVNVPKTITLNFETQLYQPPLWRRVLYWMIISIIFLIIFLFILLFILARSGIRSGDIIRKLRNRFFSHIKES